MKRCKFNFLTSYDNSVWINKDDLLKYLKDKRYMKTLIKEIEKCYYKED